LAGTIGYGTAFVNSARHASKPLEKPELWCGPTSSGRTPPGTFRAKRKPIVVKKGSVLLT
jgi:hypothetical protein